MKESRKLRNIGGFILIAGISVLVCTVNMDVPVITGAGGQANNSGLMSDRQNYTVISALMILCGFFMIVLTPKIKTTLIGRNVYPCNHCPRTIKCAATQCSHCEAEVDAVLATLIASGWITLIPCNKYGSYQSIVAEAVVFLGLPVVHIHGKAVGAGPFRTKHEAIEARELLLKSYKISSVVEYRDLSGNL